MMKHWSKSLEVLCYCNLLFFWQGFLFFSSSSPVSYYTKRDLILHALHHNSTPVSKNFKEICENWLREKYPTALEDRLNVFLKGFSSRCKKKWLDSNRQKKRFLDPNKNKVFLSNKIEIECEPAEQVIDPLHIDPKRSNNKSKPLILYHPTRPTKSETS